VVILPQLVLAAVWSGANPGIFADTTADSSRVVDLQSVRLTLEELLSLDPEDAGEGFLEDFLENPRQAPSGLESTDGADRVFNGGGEVARAGLQVAFKRTTNENSGESSFAGSPGQWLARLGVRMSEHFSWGLTTTKDAGERSDLAFLSGFFHLQDLPLGSSIVLGDYRIDAGCGLVLSGNLSGGGSLPLAGKFTSSNSFVRPYRQRNEFAFLRGLSFMMCPFQTVRICAFTSRRSIAGSNGDDGVVINRSGLFRTAGEIARKGLIQERLLGGRVEYGSSVNHRLGISFLHAGFTPDLAGSDLHSPRGSGLTVVGVDGRLVFGRAVLCAEFAFSDNGAIASAFGILMRFKRSSLVFDARTYAPDYRNPRFGGPGSGDGANEAGFGMSGFLEVTPRFELHGSLRQQWTPWATTRIHATKGKRESIAGVRRKGKAECSVEYRRKENEQELTLTDDPVGRGVKLITITKDRVKLALKMILGSGIELNSSAEVVWVRTPDAGDRGEVVREEIICRPVSWCSLSGRMVLFSSGSYESRLYDLDGDPIGTHSWNMLYGSGARLGAAVTFRLSSVKLRASLYWACEEGYRPGLPAGPIREETTGLRMNWDL